MFDCPKCLTVSFNCCSFIYWVSVVNSLGFLKTAFYDHMVFRPLWNLMKVNQVKGSLCIHAPTWRLIWPSMCADGVVFLYSQDSLEHSWQTAVVGQLIHHRTLSRQFGQLAFQSVHWVWGAGEGGWGICDCQGLHNCEWRNVLTPGTQKYFSCK